jgi:hypothetical protein
MPMNKLIIRDIRTAPDRKSVECKLDFGMLGSMELYFRATEPVLGGNSSAILASVLLPCMKLGQNCNILNPASPRVLNSIGRIQEIFNGWDSSFKRIAVTPDRKLDDRQDYSESRGVGSFFSGGIDSLFTLASHLDEIDHLVLVHGFDIDLDDHKLRSQVSEKLTRFAAKTGKKLIEIETNVGVFLRKYVSWSFGHGPALAAVGHLLTPCLRRIYIPATHSITDDVPWGSHPVVDPLWSSESLEFLHDGIQVTRVQKTEKIATWPAALECLRVCWKNPGSAYNCGKCPKCLRTMVTLQMVGSLDACASLFEEPLNLKRVAGMRFSDANSRAFASEILNNSRLSACDPELQTAVSNWLRSPGKLQRLHQYLRSIRLRRTIRTWVAGAWKKG